MTTMYVRTYMYIGPTIRDAYEITIPRFCLTREKACQLAKTINRNNVVMKTWL